MSTRLRELTLRLERTEQQVRLLQRLSRLVTRDLPLREALQGAVSLVIEHLGGDSCFLYLADRERLVLCASHDPTSHSVGRVSLARNEGLTGWVAREKRLLAISREAYLDSRFKFFSELPEDSYEAFLSAPVTMRNRVVGVINVQHRLPHAHTGDDMELLTTVGEQIGCMVALAIAETREAPADLALAAVAHMDH